MKFILVLLFAALVALTSGAYHPDYHKPKKCFLKVQKCCWKYRPCGFIIKKKKVVTRCDFVICKPVCRVKCFRKCRKIKVPKKVCVHKNVKVCYKPDYHKPDYHKPDYHKPDYSVRSYYKPKCKYVTKKHCYTKFVYEKKCKKFCKKFCEKKCKKVHAICYFFKIFKFHKFCAHLECGKVIIKGDDHKPDDFISKKGKFVKKTKVVKKIIDKKHY